MKAFSSLVMAGVLLVFGAQGLLAQPRQVTAQDLDMLTIMETRSPQGSKNVILTLTTDKRTRRQLPKAFSIRINDQEVRFADNGVRPDATAGDGVYTAAGRSERKLEKPMSMKISGEPSVSEKVTLKGSIRTVPCPPNCKSSLFGGSCAICLQVDLEITF